MKQLIKNYTTEIPVEKTIAEIQAILAQNGARGIALEYDEHGRIKDIFGFPRQLGHEPLLLIIRLPEGSGSHFLHLHHRPEFAERPPYSSIFSLTCVLIGWLTVATGFRDPQAVDAWIAQPSPGRHHSQSIDDSSYVI